MTSGTLEEIDMRISVIRDNLRQLVEQGAGSSGAADEERTANRIADYEQMLAQLLEEREHIEQQIAS